MELRRLIIEPEKLKTKMIYTSQISDFSNNPSFPVGPNNIFQQCDLIRIELKENDFIPYELVREELGIYMHMVRPVLSNVSHLDIYEMGGRFGEENVYGYLAIRKNKNNKKAYLLISNPASFGNKLLNQFKNALRRLLFFDKAIVS